MIWPGLSGMKIEVIWFDADYIYGRDEEGKEFIHKLGEELVAA